MMPRLRLFETLLGNYTTGHTSMSDWRFLSARAVHHVGPKTAFCISGWTCQLGTSRFYCSCSHEALDMPLWNFYLLVLETSAAGLDGHAVLELLLARTVCLAWPCDRLLQLVGHTSLRLLCVYSVDSAWSMNTSLQTQGDMPSSSCYMLML